MGSCWSGHGWHDLCLAGNPDKGIASINLGSQRWASSHPVHQWSHPPTTRVSFSAEREHAAGATSKKMILGGVPGVISGLAQKRSVSAFLLIFSTLWFLLVSFKAVVLCGCIGTLLWQKHLLPQKCGILFFPLSIFQLVYAPNVAQGWVCVEVDILQIFNYLFFFKPSGLIWFVFEVTAGTVMRGVFHTVSL